ncbi:MAG TPA: hypothetical protein VGO27_17985 [Candidatus Acidoferrum sp.]|nr:hypothetical protein [Candidatus Acidoferrum sp.]
MIYKSNLGWRVVGIAVCSGIAVMPMLIFGYRADSHDLNAHVSSWMEAAQQFRQLNLIPRWAAEANYGFGEPRFMFYPPLSWMLGGMLGLLLPWRIVPAVFVWLTLITAGLSMWKCARAWLPPFHADIAAVLFALNPYAIITAYIRCAYAELLASAFFPLLVWAALRRHASTRKQFAIVAAILAVIWLTNYPAGVIATYSLVVLLLVVSFLRNSWRIAVSGAASILLALGLDAAVLLPATWETRWIEINAITPNIFLPWHNFIFTRQNTDLMITFNQKISFLAVVLMVAAMFAIRLGRRVREHNLSMWWSLAALAAVSSFMMLPVSKVFWQHLPALRFVQFPWRWLFPLALTVSLLTAAVFTSLHRKWPIWLAVGCALFVLDGRIVLTKQPFTTRAITYLESAIRNATGYEGLPEYAPVGSHRAEVTKDQPPVAVLGQQSTISTRLRVEEWSPERKLISLDSREPVDLDFKLFAYPTWHATLNKADTNILTNPDTGQIRLHVPAGPNSIAITWRSSWDVTAGVILSLLAFMTLVSLCLGSDAKPPPGLNRPRT